MAPGDIQPVLLGITLPSFTGWLLIYLGLIVSIIVIQLCVWAYYNELGDQQYADPEIRARMHLGERVGVLGNRMRPAVERLAEPQRSQARRVAGILDIILYATLALAALTLTLYFHLVN